MSAAYFRTDREVLLSAFNDRRIRFRTFTRAKSAAHARAESRPDVQAAFTYGASILGLETVVSVPGVTSPRPPEVLVGQRWVRVHVTPCGEA